MQGAIVRFDISSSSEEEEDEGTHAEHHHDSYDDESEEEMDPELLAKLQLLSAILIQRAYR